MSKFWQRQVEFLQALGLVGAGWIAEWSTGYNVYRIVLGIALYQACLATVRAGK